MNHFFAPGSTLKLLAKIASGSHGYAYDYEKHKIVILDDLANEIIAIRLPINTAALDQQLSPVREGVNYIVLLIQSGNCALGYFEHGKNLDHKVFRSYMVRKKQGTSQIKYLKTKGKSRAGSRVRLGETAEFFENINGRLQDYFQQHEIHRIAMSCSKILLPYFFDAKIKTPFQKKDPRIYHIPKHIHTPIYEVMMDINKFLLKGEIIYDPIHQPIVNALLDQ